jgi:tRNA A-37 threonylcarbamoyl transferase component Bud32/tetratricopeptide (TPR) repeat protein
LATLDNVREAFAGRYQVEGEIGRGGSARVFAALDLKHDRRVAIKILRADVAESIGSERFLREIRVDAALQHPHILPLFDSGEVLGCPFFVMPLVEGLTLRALLEQKGTLPVRDAARVALQVSDALGYAHAKGFVHRDVKPENILLTGSHALLADFGIARALRSATNERVTGTGIALGTVAYMSPEQRSGDEMLDGRSDQFSLACVMYEMLVGRAPYTGGDSGSRVASSRTSGFTPAKVFRADVPAGLDATLTRALDFDPDKRFPSMGAFSDALSTHAPESGSREVVAAGGPARRWARLAGAGLAVAALAGVVFYSNRQPRLDESAIVVLPLAHEGDSAGMILDGDDCSRLLRDAVARWTGLRQIDDMRLRDSRRRRGRPETTAQAMAMARDLGAGLAVWGVVEPAVVPGDGARSISLDVYDVATGKSRGNPVRGRIDPAADLLLLFQTLVDSLLTRTAGGRPDGGLGGTRDLGALRSYVEGHRALDAWNLDGARAAFRASIDRDGRFSLAHFWLAQVTSWIPGATEADWSASASRAIQLGQGLTPRNLALAEALVSLAARRYQTACETYRDLIRRDRQDFSAWFGLGECLTADQGVLPDSSPRSGWRFRTSIHEAVNAYESALALVPTFPNAFGQQSTVRLSRWLFADNDRIRAGIHSPDSGVFYSWPELSSDTLAFVPVEAIRFLEDSAGVRPASKTMAIQRNRDRLLDVLGRWVRGDSANSLAYESLALARESNGELEVLRRSDDAVRLNGVEAIGRARRSATGEDAIRLAAIDARIALKLDHFERARSLADSLLKSVTSGRPTTARWMHGLSMLVGDIPSAIRWGRSSDFFDHSDPRRPDRQMPVGAPSAGADAMTWAASGGPPDSVLAAVERVEAAIRGDPASPLSEVRQAYTEWPLTLIWPHRTPVVSNATPNIPSNAHLLAQQALARGDRAEARRQLESVDAYAAAEGDGSVAFDAAELGARMWLALGDSSAAERVLDRTLGGRQRSGRALIASPSETAGFVRSMILRAVLADRRGDSRSAQLWATRAWSLWRTADPVLAPVLAPIIRWRP